ncbi:MAG: 3-phosphoshikimate 1-carboxyvinyltransferase [Immundisolibacter sp.]|uniref:3-phosphoshikimate 1-carboxyvinyltransferase n=1 Tax=Immundisolibacter sp. TaxID=1934948 RepID=UPI001999BFE0|nr:3-phosphoshikimate 1-carboxyvinyltransferase [Immundisolibacter sp.]MBC7162146.1 3-phosphoshikimate 1-carboxyvinyltransferase [Immundisolibacter sp.]
MDFRVRSGGQISGRCRVPGDKSISHRAVMLAALAEGESRFTGFLAGADTLATAAAFRAMGVRIDGPYDGEVTVQGVGLHGLRAPSGPLDMGNAGTGMRLLAGLLAGQRFGVTLIGDESLSRRPMRRVIAPLRQMGADIGAAEGDTPPLVLRPTAQLRGIDYVLPMASAQVKSCLLLAGLYAQGRTCVTEPAPTRDHTERMLAAFGRPLQRDGARVCIDGGDTPLRATSFAIPGDISSAAFPLVAALIAGQGELLIENVGINPTRTGILDILRAMGGDIELLNLREAGSEPVADIRVRPSRLRGIAVSPELVPLAIDEFPAIAVAAACAQGETLITGAQELRVKESDRIAAIANGLTALGIAVETLPDGLRIQGGRFRGGVVESHGDHRIAMAFSLAALRADAPVRIRDCVNVGTSFPGYAEIMRGLGLAIEAA